MLMLKEEHRLEQVVTAAVAAASVVVAITKSSVPIRRLQPADLEYARQ